jgi:hypothetical protein
MTLKLESDAFHGVQEVLNEDALWNKLNSTNNHVHTRIEYDRGKYEVQVFFYNSNGSSIFAKGKDKDRLHAMGKCLDEIGRMW